MEKPSVPTVVLIVALVGLIVLSAVMLYRGIVADPGARPEGGRQNQLRNFKCDKCGTEFSLTIAEHGLQSRDAEDFIATRALCPNREKNNCGRWTGRFVAEPVKDAPPADEGRRPPPGGSTE